MIGNSGAGITDIRALFAIAYRRFQLENRHDQTHDDRWGLCPHCKEPNGDQEYVNVGENNWLVCHKHKVAWPFGYGLLSGPLWEGEEEREGKAALVASYERVEPMDRQCADCVERRANNQQEHEAWRKTRAALAMAATEDHPF